jgi:hypothetical protein
LGHLVLAVAAAALHEEQGQHQEVLAGTQAEAAVEAVPLELTPRLRMRCQHQEVVVMVHRQLQGPVAVEVQQHF